MPHLSHSSFQGPAHTSGRALSTIRGKIFSAKDGNRTRLHRVITPAAQPTESYLRIGAAPALSGPTGDMEDLSGIEPEPSESSTRPLYR